MPNLDPRTIIVLTGVMAGLMSVVLFVLRRNFPSSIKGLTEWAAAPAVIFVAALLFATRGAIPDFLSLVVANLTLLVGLSLFNFGSERFLGLPSSIRLWGGLTLAAAPVLVWYSLVQPSYGMRLLLMAVLMIALTASHAWLLLLHGARRFSTYLTATALLIQTVVQMLRLTSILSIPADSTLFNLSPEQTAYTTTYTFCMLMITIGVLLMATDKLRAEFEHLAKVDPMTGALARRALIDACEQELERSRRNQRHMALLMMDLDHFKAINDSHGHQVGDRVLVNFAARVTTVLRRPDRFGRFGGEEFIALLPETSLEEACIVAERIRTRIEAADKRLPRYTVSIGVAIGHADDYDVDDIIARADAALYRAKAGGRNRVEAAA